MFESLGLGNPLCIKKTKRTQTIKVLRSVLLLLIFASAALVSVAYAAQSVSADHAAASKTASGVATAPPAAPLITSVEISPRPPQPGSVLLNELLHGRGSVSFSFKPEVMFVKIGMAFDPPLRGAREITVETCSGAFHDGIEFFTYPGLQHFYAEGGMAEATARLPSDLLEVRSVAIGLRRNKEACLKALHFKDAKGGLINVALASELTDAKALSTANESSAEAVDLQVQQAFKTAGLSEILDQELAPKAEDEKWIFRFRSDGTFFVYGKAGDDFTAQPGGSGDSREPSRFSALGDYRVDEVSKNSIKLHLQGERFTVPGPWDGWYCGHSCGQRDPASVAQVADPLIIERLQNGTIIIRNRANPQSRALPLSDLPVRVTIF